MHLLFISRRHTLITFLFCPRAEEDQSSSAWERYDNHFREAFTMLGENETLCHQSVHWRWFSFRLSTWHVVDSSCHVHLELSCRITRAWAVQMCQSTEKPPWSFPVVSVGGSSAPPGNNRACTGQLSPSVDSASGIHPRTPTITCGGEIAMLGNNVQKCRLLFSFRLSQNRWVHFIEWWIMYKMCYKLIITHTPLFAEALSLTWGFEPHVHLQIPTPWTSRPSRTFPQDLDTHTSTLWSRFHYMVDWTLGLSWLHLKSTFNARWVNYSICACLPLTIACIPNPAGIWPDEFALYECVLLRILWGWGWVRTYVFLWLQVLWLS